MKKLWFIGLVLLANNFTVSAQRMMSEGTLAYNLQIMISGGVAQPNDAPIDANATLYLKGTSRRTDLLSPLGNETTIFDGKVGNGVILKSFSGQKLMITLNKDDWMDFHKTYAGIQFEALNETKDVMGYPCKKAISKLADGGSLVVYYTPDIQMVNKDYNPTFVNLNGVPMEYELATGKMKVKYTITKINFDPVPAAKFEFPRSGYRVMTYAENKAMKKTN